MTSRNATRIFLLAALVAAAAATAPANAQISVNINVAPPAQQYEQAPALAPGYTWAPGYWAWHDNRYVWVRGRTVVQRPGYRWEPDRWEQRGQTYYRQAGRWEHDRDYRPEPAPQRGKKPKHWNNGNGKGGPDGKPGKGPKHNN